jgi:hypothetical protein
MKNCVCQVTNDCSGLHNRDNNGGGNDDNNGNEIELQGSIGDGNTKTNNVPVFEIPNFANPYDIYKNLNNYYTCDQYHSEKAIGPVNPCNFQVITKYRLNLNRINWLRGTTNDAGVLGDILTIGAIFFPPLLEPAAALNTLDIAGYVVNGLKSIDGTDYSGTLVDVLEISEELATKKGALRVVTIVGFFTNLNGVVDAWNVGYEKYKLYVP